MGLTEELWRHIKATQQDRMTLAPPRPEDLWQDLGQARVLIHVQSLEIGDLREAVSYLADTIESLQTRLSHLEREER